jgi:ferredoxin-NADP reductase
VNKHPLTALYDETAEVEAELAARAPDTADHWARTRELIDTYHPKRLRLTVTEVIEETPTATTFRLARKQGGDLPPFLAGQYVNVFVDGTSRPFAISSTTATRSYYDLTVRRVPAGRVSNLLIDSLTVGQELTTTGPMGTFHHNPLFHGDDVVFLAGGSGVAPAMSMIREIVDRAASTSASTCCTARGPRMT